MVANSWEYYVYSYFCNVATLTATRTINRLTILCPIIVESLVTVTANQSSRLVGSLLHDNSSPSTTETHISLYSCMVSSFLCGSRCTRQIMPALSLNGTCEEIIFEFIMYEIKFFIFHCLFENFFFENNPLYGNRTFIH